MADNKSIIGDIVSEDSNASRTGDAALKAIDDEISALEAKQKAMVEGVCDPASKGLQEKVEEKYGPPQYAFYKDKTYNDALDIGPGDTTGVDTTGTLTNWKVMTKILSNIDESYPKFVVTGLLQIQCEGNVVDLFNRDLDTTNADVGFTRYGIDDTSNSVVDYFKLDTITFDSAFTIVTVINGEQSPYIDSTAPVCFTYKYTYSNYPEQSDIKGRVESWNHAHNYINKKVGLDGTYGTKDKIATMKQSKGMVTKNQDFAKQTKNKFRDYM